jgi:hypothetical protein
VISDKLLDLIISSVRFEDKVRYDKLQEAEDTTRPLAKDLFWVDRQAGDLIAPCKAKAERRRAAEQEWTKKLEAAETELREKGVSVELYDSAAGGYVQTQNILASGAIGTFGNASAQNFQPRVDQRLLDAVKHAKSKMLDSRAQAEKYEKYARAFACDPRRLVRLSIEDIHYFGLEG